ncbi:MAG: response regulator [Bacteroidaceae bacterium]|nr:response regulator [Bacteroidaceae bacterium]
MKRTVSFLILFHLIMFHGLMAQRSFSFTDDQLSDNRIHAICEDSIGFIWIGTENGLNKFDGYRFVQYYPDDSDSLSLISNYVRSLFRDRDGRLWIGLNRGIQYMNPGENVFHRVEFPEGNTPYVQQIVQFRDGRIWIATLGAGIYVIDPSEPECAQGVAAINSVTETNGVFRAILEDEQGIVWLGTSQGLWRYEPATETVIMFLPDQISSDVVGLNMDSKGDLFISTRRDVFVWHSSESRVERITPSEGLREITHSFMSSDGEFMVSIRGNGLLVFDRNAHRMHRMPRETAERVLDRLDVSAMYMDKAGNRWVGCFLSQLMLFVNDVDRNSLTYWRFSDYSESVSGTVTALVSDDEGNLWIGYNNNGLTRLSPDGSMILMGETTSYAYSLFMDSRKRIWVGQFSGGLSLLNRKTGELDNKVRNEVASVSAIAEDHQGRIYFAELGDGFSRLDTGDMNVSHYTSIARHADGQWLSNEWIYSMSVDGHNRLWLGHDNGADCFDIDQGSFLKLTALKNVMGSSSCRAILSDSNGLEWFGTNNGLVLYDPERGTARRFGLEEGLVSNDIRGIMEDNTGSIWVSTRSGFNMIDPGSYHVSRFFSDETSYNNASTFDSRSGTVYSGGNYGISLFRPENIASRSVLNNVVVTGLYLNDRRVTAQTLSGNRKISGKPLVMTDRINLAYRDNSFTMELSTFNFGYENGISYEYTLGEKGREGWYSTPAGVNRISFYKLGYGKKRLSVRARLNDTVSDVRTFVIRIAPPWYATPFAYAFYLLIAAVIVTVIYLVYKDRRAKEVNETKLDSFINVAHEICAPMTMVISPLEEMLDDDSIPADKLSQLRLVHKNSTRILSLVNQLLDIRKYDEGSMELRFAETDLVNFLMGPFELYTQSAEHRGIIYTFRHSMPELNVWIDRDSIDKVMMNLLSNAFKYTSDEGSIDVSMDVGTDEKESGPLHNYVRISVTDTGIGLDTADTEHLFDRFYRASNEKTSATSGMGIGLNYSSILVKMHHGDIKAENRSDGVKGSVFSFRLPLGNGHLKPEEIVSQDEVRRTRLEHERTILDEQEQVSIHPSYGYVKVLVADDDESMLNYINDSLKHQFRIITCHNGKEALKIAISQKPDIIVSDVVMPEMDGIQLVKTLKSNSLVSHIPVILLSGKNKLQDRMLGMETGADYYLPKPFYMRELKTIINNLLNNRLIIKGKYSGKQEQKDKVTAVEFMSSDELFMKRVMEVVNRNISNSDFDVEQMVEEIGISRTHLHRQLKRLTGFSATKFVQNIRMQQALKLLKEKKVNVTQIAYSVGFSSQTYFSTTFKQYYGVSPLEYIRQIEAEEGGHN